jgi:transcription elongation factor Elf1
MSFIQVGRLGTIEEPLPKWQNVLAQIKIGLTEDDGLASLRTFLGDLNLFLQDLSSLIETKFLVETGKKSGQENILLKRPLSHVFGSKNIITLIPNNVFKDTTPEDYFHDSSSANEWTIIKPDYHPGNGDDFPSLENHDDNDDDSEVDSKRKKYPSSRSTYISAGYRKDYPIEETQYDTIIDNGTPFNCPRCNKSSVSRCSFDRHLLSKCHGIPMIWPVWLKQKGDFYCQLPDCPHGQVPWKTSLSAWDHHYDVHAPHAKGVFKCDECPKTFTLRFQLNNHKRGQHHGVREGRFMCRFCGKCLKKSNSLKLHERTHTGEKPEVCPHCDYRSTTKTLMNKHIKSRHVHNQFEICDLCGKSFNTKEKLKRHIETHTDSNDKCELCGKFTRNIKRHLFVVHKRSYPCPECGKAFAAERGVTMHRRDEHGIGMFTTDLPS